MNRSALFRPSTLASALAVAASMTMALPAVAGTTAHAAHAQPSVADLAYAGGEALAPEQEVLLHATQQGMSREQVQQELRDAQHAGLLSQAGEMADSAAVLHARVAFNDRQTRTILAAWEQERQRLAAVEAQQLSQQASQQLAQAQADTSTAPFGDTQAQVMTQPLGDPLADPTIAAERPEDPLFDALTGTMPPDEGTTSPLELPADEAPMPAALPAEIPITRPTDVPPGMLIDTE